MQAEARRIGYEVDLAGSLLRTSRPQHVGLLARLDQELHHRYYQELLRLSIDQDYAIVVQSVDRADDPARAARALEQMRCGVVIVIDPASCREAVARLNGIPLVGVSQVIGDWSGDTVTSANGSGMSELIDHLVGLGHKRVCFLDGPPGVSSDARREALLAAAERRCVEVEVVRAGADVQAGYSTTAKALQRWYPVSWSDSAPTALLGYNDQCAEGAYVALLRAGLRPGQDMSLAGCDNSRTGASEAFDLTTLNREPARVAELALNTALRRLVEPDGARGVAEHHVVDTVLIPRTSTSRVRTA